MTDEILAWPNPIIPENVLDIDLSKLLSIEPVSTNRETQQQFRILNSIHRTLKSIDEGKLKSVGVLADVENLKSTWAEVLNGVRRAAEQDPGSLGGGTFVQNGNSYKFSLNYIPTLGGFEFAGDPTVNQSTDMQKDFGRLFQIGEEVETYEIATKGGIRSPLTKAALDSIQKEAEKAKKEVTEHAAKEAQQVSAEVKAAVSIRDWSEYYEARCTELKAGIHGDKKKKTWRRPSWSLGLQGARRVWVVLLFITLVTYAIGAFLIFKGEGIFKVSSNEPANLTGFSRYFLGLTLYGVLAGVFIGYSYSTRQLKIHLNLLEQYRHRAVVAKTIEGVISAVVKTKEGAMPAGEESVIDQNQLDQLVASAASAMFEYRPIGHLSTKEGNSSILGEIFGKGN